MLLDVASWPCLFWLNVPIGVASLAAARRLVPAGARDTTRTLDIRSLILLGAGLPLVLYGATETGIAGATTTTLASIGLGTALAAGFLLSSKRAPHPLLNLRLLRYRVFGSATTTCALTGANMYGGLLVLPLYLQDGIGHTASETGLFLLAMGLGTAIALYVAGFVTDRCGPGVVCVIGAGLLVASSLPFLFADTLPVTALVPILVVRGVGLAWAQMPAITAAYTTVTADQIGDATTIVNIAQRVGGAIGAAGLVIVFAHTTAYTGAFGVLTVISVATAVLAARLRQRPQSA